MRLRLEALRSRTARAEGERLVVATLRIGLAQDHWLGRFSARHPRVLLEARHRTGISRTTSVIDYWISGLPAGIWRREIASYPDVRRVEALSESAEGGLYRIVHRTNPIVQIYRRLRLPVPFPLTIQGGTIRWEVAARKRDLTEILAFLERRRLPVEVTLVRQGLTSPRSPALTPKQQALLAEALRSGYFAVPRRITLTGLARQLGRSKSAVSESLAIIERKLIEAALRPVPLPG